MKGEEGADKEVGRRGGYLWDEWGQHSRLCPAADLVA